VSTKQDAASEARAIEEPVAPKRAWGPVLRGEARARLARYDAAVKREADLCAADPTRPRGQLLLVVDREVFAAMLARLDALAPLAEAAARVREARAAAGLASAAYGVAYDAWRVSPETHAAAVSRCLGESEQARRVLHDAERALLAHLALARGER
jgi:hypothetical protein